MKNFDKIDRYLNGEMTTGGQDAFKNEAANDRELRRELYLQQSEEAALERLAAKQLKERLKELGETSARKKRLPRNLGLGIIAIIFVGAMLYRVLIPSPDPAMQSTYPKGSSTLPTGEPSKEEGGEKTPGEQKEREGKTKEGTSNPQTATAAVEIAMGTYRSNLEEVNLKSNGSEQNTSPMNAAHNAFKKKKFSKAIELAQPFIDDPVWGISALEIIGHASFENQDFIRATDAFTQLDNKKDQGLGEKWQWYLLLSYAAQLPRTKSAFEKLAQQITEDPAHEFYSPFVDLSTKLKEAQIIAD